MHTITQLLQTAGCDFHLYEMGRQIRCLDAAQFNAIEQLKQPYPSPIKGKAWFAVEFFEAGSHVEPFIWFLSFSLDEFGLFQADEINHFIKMIIEAAGEELTSGKLQPKDNPYCFTPSLDKQAALNSIIRKRRKQPASAQLQNALSYYLPSHSPETPAITWQELGIQGIADIAARASEADFDQPLSQQLADWQLQPKIALLNQLEHHPLGRALCTEIIKQLDAETHPACREALLRSLSQAADSVVLPLLEKQLAATAQATLSELIAILGRHWQRLAQNGLIKLFMEQLALCCGDSDEVFSGVMADMLALPNLRGEVIAEMRDPDISEQLRAAIGRFIAAAKGKG